MYELGLSNKDIRYASNGRFHHFLTAETLAKYILQFGVNKDKDYAYLILITVLSIMIFLLVIITSIISVIQYVNQLDEKEKMLLLNDKEEEKIVIDNHKNFTKSFALENFHKASINGKELDKEEELENVFRDEPK